MRPDHLTDEIDAARREELRRMLEARRQEALGQVQTTIRDVSTAGAIGQHEVRDEMDQSEVEVRHDVNLALLEIRGQMIARIGEALAHLAEGTYGACAECGRDIALARLAAMPFATRCTNCEQEREDDNRRREAAMKRDHDRIRGYPDGDLSSSRS
jgi:DnaK suppressor protein